MSLPLYVQASYLVVAILFILGLKGMSSPGSAKRGIVQAGLGMALAVLVTFGLPGLHNIWFIVAALVIGGSMLLMTPMGGWHDTLGATMIIGGIVGMLFNRIGAWLRNRGRSGDPPR